MEGKTGSSYHLQGWKNKDFLGSFSVSFHIQIHAFKNSDMNKTLIYTLCLEVFFPPVFQTKDFEIFYVFKDSSLLML